ncbi:MAG: hypothetical protein ACTHM8_08995 [Sphingomonas sp.]
MHKNDRSSETCSPRTIAISVKVAFRLDKALVGKWLLARPVGDAGSKPETAEPLPVPVC